MEKKSIFVQHPLDAIYNGKSKILILGTFPSVKSREEAFYYAHPQNRFWQVLSAILAEDLPGDIPAKKAMLLHHGVAIWDVIASCEITGSSDSSIKHVVCHDIKRLLAECEIRGIYANGNKAKALYQRYAQQATNREIIGLPSTSPANASYSLADLIAYWGVIKENLD